MPISWMPKISSIEEQIIAEEARAWQLKNQPATTVETQPTPVSTTPAQWQPTTLAFPVEQPVEQAQAPTMPTQRVTMRPATQPPVTATPSTVTKTDKTQWWEQPAVWGENVMQSVGRGISNVPVLPKILEWASPAFEWVHEKLEKPWSAIITSPWSPSLSWKAGESWLEHEKREYDTWKAPTYVKGAAEFSMPLWWLPWFGWTAKGARALGVGAKANRAIGSMVSAKGFQLPSKDVLNNTLYKHDFMRTASLWAKDKPVLHQVVKALGGEAAFVNAESKLPMDIVLREAMNRAFLRDMRHGAKGLLLPRILKFGHPLKVMDIDKKGLVRNAIPKTPGDSQYLSDVMENLGNYTWKTPQSGQVADEMYSVLSSVMARAAEEGEPVKSFIFHRMVKGKINPETGVFEASEYGSKFERQRTMKSWREGVERPDPVVYDPDPLHSVAATIDYYVNRIAEKRFVDAVKPLGMKPVEKWASLFPEDAKLYGKLMIRKDAAEYTRQAIATMTAFQGRGIPGTVMTKIRDSMPQTANRLDNIMSLTKDQTDKILSSMARELRAELKLSPKEIKEAIVTTSYIAQAFREKSGILMSDIDDAVKVLWKESNAQARAIEKGYRETYRLNKQLIKDSMKSIRDDAQELLDAVKGDLSRINVQRKSFLKKYAYGGQILGTGEAIFNRHPSFRGRIFSQELAGYLDKMYSDTGSKWLKSVAQASGMSRLLTATLDFSAPFIQGLAVFGRNPVAWGKGVIKQYEFAIHPQRLYQYMASPEVMAIASERFLYGGSRSSFEFFEAMKLLQDIAAKIPKVGGLAQKAIIQTWGRTEAGFMGFGEVVRNEMWKALRRPGMDDLQLRELARLTDRMTGVGSSEAIGIGRTQQDFENAWMFFAPRYTRASLSYVSDVLKGTMTGAETRKALGGLMAGGMVMYFGTAKVLGQQPNLNPNSSQFMTIKIGNDYVGIGGILYGLMRLGAGVLATASEDPGAFIDPRKLNRNDNPFIKFLYQRTAPMTGLVVGTAIEQKNYFGEPFESFADWGKFLAEKVTPIALERTMPWQKTPATAPVFLAEMAGGRTFPKSPLELQNEAKDRVAKERYGVSYINLNELQQKEIEDSPEVQLYQPEIDKAAAKSLGISNAFYQWRQERDDARFMYRQNIEQAQMAVEAGVLTTVDFRKRLQNAGYGLAKTNEHINAQPRYREVIQRLNEPKAINSAYIGDIAYDEFTEAVYGGRFEDEYGIFDYDAYNAFREGIRTKYGEDVYEYVLKRELQNKADLPSLAQEYYKEREVLRPHWEVEDWAIKQYGQAWVDSLRGQAFVSRMRKQMRLMNPEMAAAYDRWYKQS